MSVFHYYGYPYGYGLTLQNPEEVPVPTAWHFVPANPADFMAGTTDPPGIMYVSLPLANMQNS